MPKKVCANGFWLFAQVEKQKLGVLGPFRDFVPLAETKWELMTYEEKLGWKASAKQMKQSMLFKTFDRIDRMIKKEFYLTMTERHRALEKRKTLLKNIITLYDLSY